MARERRRRLCSLTGKLTKIIAAIEKYKHKNKQITNNL